MLNVTWGSDAVTTYLNYLQDLTKISAEVPFDMVAYADMALWVLHAKYFCKVHGSPEIRNYYETDCSLLKLRAKNVMEPFRSLPLSILARAMEDIRGDLAGVVACYWVEVAIRRKAKSVGAKWQGGIPLKEVIEDLAREGKTIFGVVLTDAEGFVRTYFTMTRNQAVSDGKNYLT